MPAPNNTPLSDIQTLGEFGLIDHLTKNADITNASTILGVGDDAAVIDHLGKQTVVTTDLLIEGVHFDLHYHPLKYLGYKAVVANLSDVYAMNAQPTQITVSMAISSRFNIQALEEFYEGIYQACQHYDVDLVGGDTTSSTKGFIISITAIGEVAAHQVVKRSGAQVDDLVCCTGYLGSAYLGVILLEREKKIHLENPAIPIDFENEKYILQRLLRPEARKDIIQFFEEQHILPTAMMDISDGLSSEIHHICKQSQVGCMLYENKIPIHEEAKQFAYKLNIDPTLCALSGGEDYELVFTIPQTDYGKLILNDHISVIGHITPAAEGIHLTTRGGNTKKLIAQGWKSF